MLFLRLNGVRIRVDAAEASETMVSLAEGKVTERDFASWLQALIE